jgi:hypothetical protein
VTSVASAACDCARIKTKTRLVDNFNAWRDETLEHICMKLGVSRDLALTKLICNVCNFHVNIWAEGLNVGCIPLRTGNGGYYSCTRSA